MENRSVVVKGSSQKNKPANILIIVGMVLFILAFSRLLIYSPPYALDIHFGRKSLFLYVGHQYYGIFFNPRFKSYFLEYFFDFEEFYGYGILLGIACLIVGIIIKFNTENCEITVTNDCITGKLTSGKNVCIPLDQVTAFNRISFNGISISSIGSVSNFYCIKNRNEVMTSISQLLANSKQIGVSLDKEYTSGGNSGEAERLKNLKELLDSGVLTQEEYDTKKKQILGF